MTPPERNTEPPTGLRYREAIAALFSTAYRLTRDEAFHTTMLEWHFPDQPDWMSDDTYNALCDAAYHLGRRDAAKLVRKMDVTGAEVLAVDDGA